METQSKISTKKVKRFVLMSVLLIAFSAILIAANQKQSDKLIGGTIVTLKNHNKEENFLKVADVEMLIAKQGINVTNQTISSINIDEIERVVQSNPWIKQAEVYVDNNGMLNVEVLQRLPIARVFNQNGQSFYLDNAGFEMPLSNRYAYSVPVFTNYTKPLNDSIHQHLKASIAYLSTLIKEDTFWNAQITQVDIVGLNDYNFYTTLGKQKVRFGDTSLAADKFQNLMSFYQDVSNKVGWDRYNILDLRFKDQVIASPSIGWIPPRDTVTDHEPVKPVVNTTTNTTNQQVVVAKPAPKPAIAKQDKKTEPVKTTAKKEEPKKKEEAKKEVKKTNTKPVAQAAKTSKDTKPKPTAAKPANDKNKKDNKK